MIPNTLRIGLIVFAALTTGACATKNARTSAIPALQQADERPDPAPDNYVRWMRVVGLYPITRIPVASGFRRWKLDYANEVKAWSGQRAQAWSPDLESHGVPAAVKLHAPLFLIEGKERANRFGLPQPAPDGKTVIVDTDKPTVLWRSGTTRFKGQTLNQISYILWFPERPKTRALDLLGGSLDIVIVRVTLGADGKPVLYDTIHGCGCYHLFFPAPPTRRKPMPEDDDLREEAFVPFEAPALKEGERLGIRITSGAHYVVGLDVVGLEALSPGSSAPYILSEAEAVNHAIAHLYDRHGILPQSRRLERFILWPMGIRSPGAMRAWGRHATAFVGKRHFTDADLLDRAFE